MKKRSFSKEEKFAQVSSFEGYLNKLSPQFLVGFQKRYFCVRDHGQKLIYYKEKPKIKDKPKGMLEIKDITEIWKKNKTDFFIQYEERLFELRAEDEELADKWMYIICFLRDYLKTETLKKEESIRLSVESDQKIFDKKKEKWRVSNLDTQIFNDIQAEHEINLINQNKEKSVSSPQNELNLDNMHILQVKGIKEFTDKIDSEILKTRICMGFLEKKRKKLSTYQKRWFVLISERPLNKEVNEEFVLSDEQIPPWMEFNTIFYFHYKSNDDKSPFVNKISLRTFLSINMDNIQHSPLLENNKGYSFKLATKERTYCFTADLVTEMNKWIIALEGARENYLKMHPNIDNSEVNYSSDNNSPEKTERKVILRTATIDADNVSFTSENLALSESKSLNINRTSLPSRILVKEKEEKIVAKEGYLFKKSLHKLNKFMGWEKRYVSLKNGIFFWSISNTNTEPRNIIPIKNLDKCEALKENQFLMIIGPKIYKFKTENNEDRDKWISYIERVMKDKKNSSDKEESEILKEENEGKYKFSNFSKRNLHKSSGAKDDIKEKSNKQSLLTKADENEDDSIFEKYFALNSAEKLNRPEGYRRPPQEKSLFKKIFCCCFKVEEDDYYSHF